MSVRKEKQCIIIIILNIFFIQIVHCQASPADSESRSNRIQDLIDKGAWNLATAPSRWFYSYLTGEEFPSQGPSTQQSSLVRAIFSYFSDSKGVITTTVTPPPNPIVAGDQNGGNPNVKIKNVDRKKRVKNSNKSLDQQLSSNEKKRNALDVKIKQLKKDVQGSEGASDRNRLRAIELQEEAKELFDERARIKEEIGIRDGHKLEEDSLVTETDAGEEEDPMTEDGSSRFEGDHSSNFEDDKSSDFDRTWFTTMPSSEEQSVIGMYKSQEPPFMSSEDEESSEYEDGESSEDDSSDEEPLEETKTTTETWTEEVTEEEPRRRRRKGDKKRSSFSFNGRKLHFTDFDILMTFLTMKK